MSEEAQRAKALFLEGYNCAQAVAGAFAPEMGLSVDAAARLASGFRRRHGTDAGGMRCGKRYDAGRKRAARLQRPRKPGRRKPIPTR